VLLAFGLKLPIVPLHGWQPLTYSQAPTPVAMLLSGAVSKLGAYGLLRFGVGCLPDAWSAWSPWIAAIGAISAIYGALNAIAQLDMRRLVAYSSLGHMGMLVLALAAATPLSLQGVIAQMLAHGLIIALLFCLVGLIEARTGTTAIPELSGLLNPQRGLPFTLGLMLVALMAAADPDAGLPGGLRPDGRLRGAPVQPRRLRTAGQRPCRLDQYRLGRARTGPGADRPGAAHRPLAHRPDRLQRSGHRTAGPALQ